MLKVSTLRNDKALQGKVPGSLLRQSEVELQLDRGGTLHWRVFPILFVASRLENVIPSRIYGCIFRNGIQCYAGLHLKQITHGQNNIRKIYADKKVKSPISPPYPKTCDYKALSSARSVLYHPRLSIDQCCQENN